MEVKPCGCKLECWDEKKEDWVDDYVYNIAPSASLKDVYYLVEREGGDTKGITQRVLSKGLNIMELKRLADDIRKEVG